MNRHPIRITVMRVNDKEEIIRTLESIEPDDFEFIKVNCGNRHKCFGHLNKRPIDDLMGFMFDLSLSRRITSLKLMDGGMKYSSPLVIGTTESRDGTTNIDAEVIEAIGLVLKRRIEAEFPLTKQYMSAVEEREKERQEEERQAKRKKREKPENEKKSLTELMDEVLQEVIQKKKEQNFFNPFNDDFGMP